MNRWTLEGASTASLATGAGRPLPAGGSASGVSPWGLATSSGLDAVETAPVAVSDGGGRRSADVGRVAAASVGVWISGPASSSD